MSEIIGKYRVIDKNRKEKKNLEGIAPLFKDSKRVNKRITLARWNNWDTSLWVKIEGFDSTIILDSGVIEELADVIRFEKKRLNENKRIEDILVVSK